MLSIIGAAVLAHAIGIGKATEHVELSGEMMKCTFALNVSVIRNPRIWSTILVLFILDFHGSIAQFIGPLF